MAPANLAPTSGVRSRPLTDVRDGYGQTETGQVTANPYGVPARLGPMGRPLPCIPGVVDAGEPVVDPATVPTFFLRYLVQPPPDGLLRTGDQVRQDDAGYLYFEGRTDDVIIIISADYRIGPFEVESVLARHPAVADVAVVAAPDAERGSVVGAIVVLQSGRAPATLAPILAQLIRPWFRDQA
jgi:acyl-coenzyme A synthetase/AMP-(fatty) acid ligase